MLDRYLENFKKHGLRFGVCFGSKSLYIQKNGREGILFNARIYTKEIYEKHKEEIEDFFKGQKFEIWYGDLNWDKDKEKLQKIAKDINKNLIITTEHGNLWKEIKIR